MSKLAFATECDFRQVNRAKARARKEYNKGIKRDYKKHHKLFSNHYTHLFKSGVPYGSS